MATPPAERPRPSFEHLFAGDPQDRSGIRLGLLAATAVHLIIFSLTWPTLATEELVPPPRTAKLFHVSQIKFEPPIRCPVVRPKVPRSPIVGHLPTLHEREPEIRGPATKPIENYPPYGSEEFPVPRPPDPPPKTIVEAGTEVEPPRVIHRVEPRYTETARRIRYEGVVVLSLLIDTNGRVTDVSVLRGLRFGLTENAVSAARQWLFEPCIYNEKPVSVRMTLTVHFRIAS